MVGDGVAASKQNPQSLQGKQPRETQAKRHSKTINSRSMVSVVIPSTPSAPGSTCSRTWSRLRRPRCDDSPCSSNEVSPSRSSSSSNPVSGRPSSPPSSPPNFHINKEASMRDACPVCKEPGKLFRIKDQGFIWCDKHSRQIPVLRSSGGRDSNVLRSRDDRRTPKKCAPKSKAPALTRITAQSSLGKRMNGQGNGKTSKKRACSPVVSKRKCRHTTPNEDLSSEST